MSDRAGGERERGSDGQLGEVVEEKVLDADVRVGVVGSSGDKFVSRWVVSLSTFYPSRPSFHPSILLAHPSHYPSTMSRHPSSEGPDLENRDRSQMSVLYVCVG